MRPLAQPSAGPAGGLLTLDGIRKRFGSVVALDGVSLTIPRGSRTAVVGPSGGGKSTLLRILAGFDAPDAGQVHLDGALLADSTVSVPTHRRGIGLMAQEGALFPHLSVADNIGFGLPGRSSARTAWIEELADLVELDRTMLRRMPDALSGGQQQRVALARALACRPRLMLLDEPFSALDTALRESTRRAVSDLLGRAGITVVLVTHDQVEALSFADQVAVLHEGRLLQAGPPRDLYLRPCNEMVARFLGDALVLQADVDDGWAECALGRIRIGQSRQNGPAQVMLRPEQLSLRPAREDGAEGGVTGTVTHVEFGGPQCTVSIRLPPSGGGGIRGLDTPLVVGVPQNTAPHEGDTVSVGVAGEAHVL